MTEHVESVFLNSEHFTESVTFGGTDVDCLVSVDGGIRDNEGDDRTIFTGEISFPGSQVAELQLDSDPVLTVTVFGEVWDIIDVGPDILGMRQIGIRRTESETKHSNAFTINQIQNLLS